MTEIPTPYYLIDEAALQRNLELAAQLSAASGAKLLLALKCFASWPVADLVMQYLDGTTSSSLFELRLGREKFGGETHAYSVAWADHELPEALSYADKIIFNSLGQLQRHAAAAQAAGIPCGLRLNPGISASGYDLADPARPFSRLGEGDVAKLEAALPLISGVMIHNNCENQDFARFDTLLTQAEQRYGALFAQLDWISLGGGIHFTAPGYPLAALAQRLRDFAQRYGVQVYLEPGATITENAATLEVTVLDTLENGKQLAIIDSSTEAHMLDYLIYDYPVRIEPNQGPHRYMVCGKTCLAGDVFGEFDFAEPLSVGSRLSIQDAGAYTMVKKNWFNGVAMPAIAVKGLDGQVRVVRSFTYQDYASSLG